MQHQPTDTVTMTRAALIDLLTTAASIGLSLRPDQRGTRGDVRDALGPYGFRADSTQLASIIETAELAVRLEREALAAQAQQG